MAFKPKLKSTLPGAELGLGLEARGDIIYAQSKNS